jgi:hypothetical protein
VIYAENAVHHHALPLSSMALMPLASLRGLSGPRRSGSL